MIIFGSRSRTIAQEHSLQKCPYCGMENTIDLYVLQKYIHIFWIPFFPSGKTGASQCSHCKQVLKPAEMPSSLAQEFNNLKSKAKTPIWSFALLGIIAALIIIGVIANKQRHSTSSNYITAPLTGDIFEVKTKTGNFTLYKIADVKNDSVYVRMSDYEATYTTGLEKLKDKTFSDSLFGFSKQELKQMFDNGEIKNVERRQ